MYRCLFGWCLITAAVVASAGTPHRVSGEPTAVEGDDDALKAVDESFVQAFNKKDVNGVLACYADDAVVMEPGPGMMARGKEQIRKSFTEMFGTPGGMELRLDEAHYRAVGNLGYGYILWTMTIKDEKGKVTEMKGRASDVMEKRGGKWVLIVDHASVPLPPPPPAPSKK
jgi:uncharacterized protein (TIGR02246 family)